jgi:hypothetical protein
MSYNDKHIQLASAIEPVVRRPTNKGTTFTADIRLQDGRRAPAFLKLLKVEDIAREALSLTLARVLALPVLTRLLRFCR